MANESLIKDPIWAMVLTAKKFRYSDNAEIAPNASEAVFQSLEDGTLRGDTDLRWKMGNLARDYLRYRLAYAEDGVDLEKKAELGRTIAAGINALGRRMNELGCDYPAGTSTRIFDEVDRRLEAALKSRPDIARTTT